MQKGSSQILEVIVSFDGAVLGVHHLKDGEALRFGPPQERPDYALQDLPMALPVAEGGALPAIAFPDGAAGEVVVADAARSLAQLRAAGLCQAVPGGHRYALPAGALATLRIGTLQVRASVAVLERRTVPAPLPVDWRAQRFTLAPLLAYGAALGLAFLLPPDPRALASNDLSRLDNATLRAQFIPPVVEPEVKPAAGPEDRAVPRPAAGAVGRAGHPKGKDRVATTVREPRPARLDSADLREQVRRLGALAVLADSRKSGPLSDIVDRDVSALGRDSDNVLAGLLASADQLGWGDGGARLVQTGPGPGGGGIGSTIAATLNGVCGDGAKCEPMRGGRGSGLGRLPGRGHRPEVPDAPSMAVAVSPGLDKDTVRRVIRSHMNEFKYCYERELVRSPELAGRVVMAFLINKDGRVVSAVARESSLESGAVHGCLSQAISRLSFPLPQGAGLVQVSYPFVFQMAGR